MKTEGLLRDRKLLRERRRLLVLGCPGAGKTTLARFLGEVTGLPVVHLDREFWRAGWVPTPEKEWDERLAEIVAGPAWILDGNYDRTLAYRLRFAELAFFLDFTRPLCLARVAKRTLTSFGRTRAHLAPGCPERIDVEFVKWVWHFHRDVRPGVLSALANTTKETPTDVLRFASPRELEAWTRRLAPGAARNARPDPGRPRRN